MDFDIETFKNRIIIIIIIFWFEFRIRLYRNKQTRMENYYFRVSRIYLAVRSTETYKVLLVSRKIIIL